MALHTLSAALVVTDVVARSWRIGVMLRVLGTPIRALDSFVLTTFGDAAAAITPWRIAGEPARIFGATWAGAPASTVIVALGVESIINYAILALIGIALAAAFGSEWTALVRATASVASRPEALVVLAAVLVLGVVVFRRLPPHIAARAREFLARSVRQLRNLRPRDLTLVSVLSAVSLVARIGILPLVVAAFGQHAPFGAISLASFALLNGQILVPTPSGAGAVELAAAGGAIGIHERTGAVLAAWRVYVTIVPIVGGLAIGAARYGVHTVMRILKRREAV